MLYRKEYDLQILRTHVPPYERYGTRRLLRSNWTCELVPLNGCGKSALRSKAAGQYGFAETPTMLIRGILNNYGLFQISRERSKKTEAVFLVGSRRSGGKSKSLRAPFLLPAFSFGEVKENADGQLQISRVYLKTPNVTGSEKFLR